MARDKQKNRKTPKNPAEPKLSKKEKKENRDVPIINEPILEEQSRNDLKAQLLTAEPYKYLHIKNLFNPSKLRLAQDEAKHHLTAEFKESDLFKVFQTMDLGNLLTNQENKSKIFHLLKFKEYLYSSEFRQFVSDITGVEDLTDRTDCSMNIYTNSCHLLCHDDVIGTRRVSYIIYLTDPDEEWVAEDGGALELYPLEPSSVVERSEGGKQGIPTALPSVSLLPTFNSMIIFPVQPGRSYHSVQEVFSDKARMSIR